MIAIAHAGEILSEMVHIGRAFRVASQHGAEKSLTGTRFGLLQQLRHGDSRLCELAHQLAISAPVASRAVDSLEDDGLVQRRTDPQDARASLISITERGLATLTEHHTVAVRKFADALSDWSAEDAEQAIKILRTLNAQLCEVLGSSPVPQRNAVTRESEIHA